MVSAEKPAKAARADELADGAVKTAVLELGNSFGSAVNSFSFKVPKNAYAVRITVAGAAADLDLFVNPGTKINDLSEAVYSSERNRYNETLFISRQSETPLESGLYFVDVAYQYDFFPESDGEKIESIEYEIKLDIIGSEPKKIVRPGEKLDLTLEPESGMFATFAVDIPRGTDDFRVDVFGTDADIDMYASVKAPAKSRDEALYVAESMLGNESLLISGYSGEKPLSGRYYISLMDQLSKDIPQKLSVVVTAGRTAPDFLSELPQLPSPSDGFESAILSTVQVVSENAKGSGCLVSRDGLLLTNWHVIEGDDGNPADGISIAMSLSDYHPPRELFTAEAVYWDEKLDLALLKITGGRYGSPIPYGYSFPYFRLGKSARLRIGQPIGIIGYPEVGGTGSRTSVTFTSGNVSGFEKAGDYSLIKTDAMIGSGNSGGAAINAYHELIGIPGYVMDIDNDKMGYIYPLTGLPYSWERMINEANR